MLPIERRLAFAGLALFVAGLVIGFAIRAFPNPRAALSAHLNAVQSGTFLIVLGLLWPRLAVWKAAAQPLSHLVWIAFWGLEVGMVLAALIPPTAAGQASPRGLKLAAVAFQGLSAVAMLAGLGALLLTFRSAPGPATDVAALSEPAP
jgi:hydroxylaminobenzene mutase